MHDLENQYVYRGEGERCEVASQTFRLLTQLSFLAQFKYMYHISILPINSYRFNELNKVIIFSNLIGKRYGFKVTKDCGLHVLLCEF